MCADGKLMGWLWDWFWNGDDMARQTKEEKRLCELECMTAANTLAISKLHKQGAKIMSELTDLQDAIAEVKTDLAAEKAEVTAELKKLQDKIDAGSPVTKQDLIDLTASVKEIGAGVKDIITPT